MRNEDLVALQRRQKVNRMDSLRGSTAWRVPWLFAVLVLCSLLALARSDATLDDASDEEGGELERKIVRLQRERDSALSLLASVRGQLEICRRFVNACESRSRVGGRRFIQQKAMRKRGMKRRSLGADGSSLDCLYTRHPQIYS